ncbi:putative Iron-sulfur flavoprotein [Blattamonas nauphoetae]|uniref:Iron-sulfur flavoprotein n=1 Tax=Blattamonas nauphoetae TaxID=2049346 RepID=A0ABQ9Y348_9EUKA|nr:putative Iron-sulfur flavoprotein [Blattamonas nauphoetae]
MSAPKPLKVVAFNGSAKINGNTAQLIEMVLAPLREAEVECEVVQVGNAHHVTGCRGCSGCKDKGKCIRATEGDPINEWYAKMVEADGILIASPTHYANVTVEIKSLIDRCGWIAGANGKPLRHKLGAAIAAVRRGGATNVFNAINHFYTIQEIHVVSSRYWNDGIGLGPGDVQKDEEGKMVMKTLGENMAMMLKKMNA